LLVAAAGVAGECPVAAEREHYGLDHSEAAARVLSAWKFPDELCAAVAHLHTGDASNEPLTRAVRAGACLASRIPGSASHDPGDLGHERLTAAHVSPSDIAGLLETVEQRSATISDALSSK
jgi:HD-like signal output (HDOD) protein